MNKDTLLLITSDKMILKIMKSHSCKVTLFRGQDSNLRPLAYETSKLPTAPSRDMMLFKIPPAFTSGRYYYNSILML